jgi:hypothetical protein
MRKNEKGEIIITRRKAADLFCLLSNARLKLTGKLRSDAIKFWKEFEAVFELRTEI